MSVLSSVFGEACGGVTLAQVGNLFIASKALLGPLRMLRCLLLALLLLSSENARAQFATSNPARPLDRMSQLLATMSEWQVKRLSSANQGDFASAMLPAAMSGSIPQCQRHFDAGHLYGPSPTFSSNSNCVNSINSAASAMWSYSGPGINATTLMVVFVGGGHYPLAGGSADNSVFTFNMGAAAQSILQTGTQGNWIRAVDSATMLSNSRPRPPWSNQCGRRGTKSCSSYWADTNDQGINRDIATHTGGSITPLGRTHKWIYGGYSPVNPAGSGGGGQGCTEIFDDKTKSVSLLCDFAGDATWQAATLGGGTIAYDDQSGSVYAMNDNYTAGYHRLYMEKWVHPTSDVIPTPVELVNRLIDGIAYQTARVVPDPFHGALSGSTKVRAYVQLDAGGSGCSHPSGCKFFILNDINGIAGGPTVQPDISIGNAPTFDAAVTQAAICWSQSLREYIVWLGASHLYPIVPTSSTRGWTWGTPIALSGDLPRAGLSGATTNAQCEVDATRQAIYLANQGDVWVVKAP
jgi:hypothetical protein